MSVNTLLIECGHCGNTAPMEIKAEYVDTVSHGNPPYTDEVTTRWDLLLCPVCRKPTLHETIWSPYDIEPETMAMIPENKTLYPSPVATTEVLPETVRKSYKAALRVRNIEPNAFAVLIGRTLEFICQDKNAVGRDLNAKLDNLSDRHEIPERLAEIAHKIRIPLDDACQYPLVRKIIQPAFRVSRFQVQSDGSAAPVAARFAESVVAVAS